MRSRLLRFAIVLIVGAAATACGSASEGPKSCTLIGCSDVFVATVRSADGSFSSGAHRIETMVDGVSATCRFTFPLATAQGGDTVLAQCGDMTVMVRPEVTCTNTATSSQCEPIPGKFIETITLLGTPAQVHVWQYVDDVPILDAAVAPSYMETQPNGPGCGPICQQASASWTLM